MKKGIIAATLFLVALRTTSIATAKDNTTTLISSRNITTGSFKKLIVDKNIHVVLVADESKTSIIVTGDKDYIQNITVSTDKDVMKISSAKNLKNRKVTVYIPVKGLSSIELKSGARVSSEGILSSPLLSVLVHEGTTVELQNFGKVEVTSSDDCEFIYEKNEVSKIVYAN